ncbi:unnamed protein product [Protopolystoma xenopodis]|uniref:Dihydroorotate dehydrogenase catalytic domain-containing protein n=1 Tax=Protopolystoma xenopodis TaxID=117903 RepID=A0A3S5CHG4_9PLAT|nr:unnamed protein product [Protopolystoma xenopodis]
MANTRVDGLIVSNTALVSQEVAEVCGATAGLVPTVGTVYGGISGPPLRAPSTACLARLHQLTQASRLPLIGVGGVDSGEAAAEKLAAGASLVQLYTGIAYHGLPLARKVVRELAEQI